MRRVFLFMLLVFLIFISGCFKRDLPESEFQVSSDSNIRIYVDVLEVSAITNKGLVVLDNFETSTIELVDGLNDFLKEIWTLIGDTLYRVKLITGDASCSVDYVEYPCTVSGNNINVMIDPFQMEDLTNVFYEFDIKLMKRGGRNPSFMLNPVIRVTDYFINNPPLIPDSPSPYDGATDIPLRPTLSWNCQDPDGGELSYDVYLSEPNDSSAFTRLTTDHKMSNFEIETDLQNVSTYYWKVVAKDSFGASTEGSVWSFSTSDTVIPEGSFLLKFSLAQPEQASFALQDDRELSLVYTNIDEEDSSGRFVLVDGTNSVQLNKGGTYVLGIAERYDGVITVLGLIGDAELGLHTLPVSYAANDIIDLGNLILNGGVFTSELITGQDLCNILGHSYETLAAFGQFDMTLKKFLNPDINKNGLYDREEEPETNWTFAVQTDSKWFNPNDIVFDDVSNPIRLPIEEFVKFGVRYAIGLRNVPCLPTSVETSVPGRLTLPDGLGQIEVPGGERESGFHWEPYHWETGWGEIWFQLEEVGETTPPFNGDYVLELGNDYENVYYFDNFDFLTPDDYLEGFVFALSAATLYPSGQFKTLSWRWYRMLDDGSYVLATPEQVAMTSRQLSFYLCTEGSDDALGTGGTWDIGPEYFGYDSTVAGSIPMTEESFWTYKNVVMYEHYPCNQYDKGNNRYTFLFRADVIGEPTDPSPAEGSADVSLQPTLSWESFTDGETLEYTVQISLSREDFDNYIFFETTTDSTSITIPPENELNFSPIYYWRVFPSMEDPLHPGETITYDFQCSIWSFSTVHPGNYPPSVPSNPDPTNGATEVMLRSSLSWTSSDPDNDPIVYDVYFGTSSNANDLSLIAENYGSENFPISDFVSLNPETIYYWKVVAEDINGGISEGPIWSFSTMMSCEQIFFVDPNLSQVVREYIGKDPGEPIYANEVLDIEGFHAEWRNISNISGIEHLSNLRFLYINENNISDISPLASLNKLEYLNIETNNILDISPLSAIYSLTGLSMGNNPIEDFSPIESLSSLQSLAIILLSLTDADIGFLENLPQLTELWISRNSITDLSPIQGMVNLGSLFAYDNKISNISPLANMAQLSYLGIWNNRINDLSPISNLTSLIYLNCSDNLITDISLLSNLINLQELHISGNLISSIVELSQSSQESLLFKSEMSSFYTPAVYYTGSGESDEKQGGLFDIQALEGLVNLRALNLSSNVIADITPLESLVNLEWLSLYDNEIEDISPLVNNSGIGSGDFVDVNRNYLDLTEGSTDILAVGELQSRGVNINYQDQKTSPSGSYIKFNPQTGEKIRNLSIVFFRESQSTSTGTDNGTLDLSYLESGTWRYMAKVETLSFEGVKLYLIEGSVSVPGANVIELSGFTDHADLTLIDENGMELSDSSLVTARFFLSDFYDNQSTTSYSEVKKLYGNIPTIDTIHFIEPAQGRHWFTENLSMPSSCSLSLENCATLNFISSIDLYEAIDLGVSFNFRNKVSTEYHTSDFTIRLMSCDKVGYHYGVCRNGTCYYSNFEGLQLSPGQTLDMHVLEGLRVEISEISDDATTVTMNTGNQWLSARLKDASGCLECQIPVTITLYDAYGSIIDQVEIWNWDFGHEFNLPEAGNYELVISAFLVDFPNSELQNTLLERTLHINVEEPEEIFFSDPNLDQVVREYIGKNSGEPIYANEVLDIENFHAEWRSISNISGIEHLSNLRFLYINENNISDISPLASLTKLEYLNIETNNISDISILTQLASLQGLSTGRNPIIDLSVVSQIPNLNSLALVGLGLENSDILFLGENTKIQTIWLNQNNITDLTTLASMVYLNSLDFSNNLITDLSPLQNLSYLTGIWGYSNQITSLEPLQYLANLSALFMGGNQITDLSPLASLTQISHLECSSNQISNILPLAALPNLQWVSVSNNDIQDILPLVNNTGIDSGDYVDISFNFLDLTPDGTDMTNIALLLERGVDLAYEPQK